jgi:MYXO-CTERM domain-containing protein
MGSGGSATGDRPGSGGSAGTGGTPSPGAPGPITEPAAGCGCAVAAPPHMPALLVVALLMMLGALVRRR